MAGTIAPFPLHQFFTDAGAVAASYRLFWYQAGTSTAATVYTDSALTTPHSQPITLNSAGRPSSGIFLVPGSSYKLTLAPPGSDDPPTSPVFSQDNIEAVPAGSASADTDVSGTAGETLAAGDAVYLSDGSGGATVGRWYLADSDNTYSSTAANIIGFATEAISTGSSGAIRVKGRVTGLTGLTAGTVYYVSATAGALTSSAPTNAIAVLQADATTAGVILEDEPSATASVAGEVNLTTQTLGAGTKSVDKLTYKPGGVTTFDANASGRILGPYVTTQATSGTSETSAIATAPTIKANTLNASGDVLRATYVGTASANAQATTYRVKLGGTTITTITFTPNNVLSSWKLIVDIQRTSSASNQNITSVLSYSEAAATTAVFTDVQAGTKDLSTALTFDVTMQRAVAGSVTFLGGWFEVIGA